MPTSKGFLLLPLDAYSVMCWFSPCPKRPQYSNHGCSGKCDVIVAQLVLATRPVCWTVRPVKLPSLSRASASLRSPIWFDGGTGRSCQTVVAPSLAPPDATTVATLQVPMLDTCQAFQWRLYALQMSRETRKRSGPISPCGDFQFVVPALEES